MGVFNRDIFSFFTLIWGLPLALGAVYGVRAAHIQRQNFRRQLEASTINDRDAEAHFQLGLIYQRRRQFGEAAARFKRAVEIDPKEPDANFELGRIARQEGRYKTPSIISTPSSRTATSSARARYGGRSARHTWPQGCIRRRVRRWRNMWTPPAV